MSRIFGDIPEHFQDSDNAYGYVLSEELGRAPLHVICGHGGSMWLCAGCGCRMLDEQRTMDKDDERELVDALTTRTGYAYSSCRRLASVMIVKNLSVEQGMQLIDLVRGDVYLAERVLRLIEPKRLGEFLQK